MYEKKDFSKLKGMAGFSDKALDLHFALYEGYVKNTNAVLEKLQKMRDEKMTESVEYAEFQRRLGWEFNGMRLHEYYFGALGGNGEIDKEGRLFKSIFQHFGDFDVWRNDFLSTAKMRGIGWAVLYQDQTSGKLMNFWINEHNVGHPAGANPIIALDIFEHAYIPDYGKDRALYLEAFMKNLNWQEIEKRLK